MPRAPTYFEEPTFDYKKPRLRCMKDKKVIFVTEEAAQRAVDRITERGQPMKYYRGRCGHLHIAKIK